MHRKLLLLILTVIMCLALIAAPAAASPPTVILDGELMQFDVPPTIEEGRTLVPLRAIFEGLGAEVEWDGQTRTVTATRANVEIKLQIGKQTAYRNGSPVSLDVPAKIIDNRTMVPLRFVSESLGAAVAWDGAARKITISSSGSITIEYSTISWNEGTYTGQLKDNIPHGQGTWTHPDGFKYVGEFSDGKMDGQGTWTQPDGYKYTGEFVEGKIDGKEIWTPQNVSQILLHSKAEMEKAIRDKYLANTWLGSYSDDFKSISGGMYVAYSNGSIYYGDRVGRAHIVKGSILNKWLQKQGASGFLKFPTTDELVTPDQKGRYNHFEGGSIYWHPDIGAHEVHGLIRDKWQSLSWEKGLLGYPLTDELVMADGVGRYSVFQGGRIYYHPNHGTHYVNGNIYLRWLGDKDNNEVGDLGYPQSDPQTVSGPYISGIKQTFQKGEISKYYNVHNGIDLRGEIARRGIEVRHQGNNRDTCSVQAMTFLLEYAYTGKYGDSYKHLSVEYLNHAANKAANNTDDGDYFSSIEAGYNQYGIVKEALWKYDKGWTYDFNEAEKILTKQLLDAGKLMISDGRKRAGSFVKPFERDSSLTNTEFVKILQLLDQGIPVALGRNHSMAVVGYQYDSTYDGGGYFIFRDSYGSSNGIYGYKIESFAQVKSKTNDVYVFN
ncbi:hypothetical protein ASZ90_018512 [hydrocarbon metagenome]|uniref:Copper amine oxidase-like N-terminal domain-containing protein n=1 Tax=hydrocarbon metagenome TaxID=938273 RepID=A0A0W8E627_9ZZZZ